MFLRRYPSQEGPVNKRLKHSPLEMILPRQETLSHTRNTKQPSLSYQSLPHLAHQIPIVAAI